MLVPLFALVLLADASDACSDLGATVAAAAAGANCAALATIRSCLDDRLSSLSFDATDQPAADDHTSDAGSSPEGQLLPRLPCGPDDMRGDGGLPLPPGCQKPSPEAALRTALTASLEQQRATAQSLLTLCSDAAQRAATQKAAEAADAKRAATEAEASELLKVHPELPAQAISAVLCRTETYRRWVLGQIKRAQALRPIDPVANLTAQHELHQLSHYLEEKEAEARESLRQKFHARSLSCDNRVVKLLSACATTPTLTDDNGDPYVKDPEEPCDYDSSVLGWYETEGWYLGLDWFQPTRIGLLQE